MSLYRRWVRHWLTSVAVAVWFVLLAWHFESWVIGICAGLTLGMAATDTADAYYERWRRNYLRKRGIHDRDMP